MGLSDLSIISFASNKCNDEICTILQTKLARNDTHGDSVGDKVGDAVGSTVLREGIVVEQGRKER